MVGGSPVWKWAGSSPEEQRGIQNIQSGWAIGCVDNTQTFVKTQNLNPDSTSL